MYIGKRYFVSQSVPPTYLVIIITLHRHIIRCVFIIIYYSSHNQRSTTTCIDADFSSILNYIIVNVLLSRSQVTPKIPVSRVSPPYFYPSVCLSLHLSVSLYLSLSLFASLCIPASLSVSSFLSVIPEIYSRSVSLKRAILLYWRGYRYGR